MFSSDDAKLAQFYHDKVVGNEQQRRKLLLENMKYISELKDTNLYKIIVGDEDAPWTAYLGQLDVFYSRMKTNEYSKIYNKFVKQLEINPETLLDIPYSRLSLILDLVFKENVQEWLDKARTLTAQDFADEVRIAKGGRSYLDCAHTFDKYEVCRVCGSRHKVDAVEKPVS